MDNDRFLEYTGGFSCRKVRTSIPDSQSTAIGWILMTRAIRTATKPLDMRIVLVSGVREDWARVGEDARSSSTSVFIYCLGTRGNRGGEARFFITKKRPF